MKEVYNVYLITGSNDSVISNTVSDILKQVNCDDNNKIIYNLKENTISDVIEEANTVSLFRSNKVILVYSSGIDKLDDEELIMYLNNYNKDVYLIFIVEKSDARKKIVKLINEKGISIDSDNVDKSYNKNYVVSYLKDNGYKMNSNVIECFLSRVSDNINDIRNELDKLFIYKLDDKNISLDDVKLITYDNITLKTTNGGSVSILSDLLTTRAILPNSNRVFYKNSITWLLLFILSTTC